MPLSGDEVVSRAFENLDRRLAGRAIGGVEGVIGDSAHVSAAWLPSSVLEEPLFLIYSISKTFTAALALMLQEEKRLSLDDPAARWIAELAPWPGITVRRLLAHTAGVPGLWRARRLPRRSSRLSP